MKTMRLQSLRYYVLYWLLPLSWVPVIMFPSEDKFVNGMAMSVLTVIWWLLSIWTEETMRFVDRQRGS